MPPARLWGFEDRERLFSSGRNGDRRWFGWMACNEGTSSAGIEIRFGTAAAIARGLRSCIEQWGIVTSPLGLPSVTFSRNINDDQDQL